MGLPVAFCLLPFVMLNDSEASIPEYRHKSDYCRHMCYEGKITHEPSSVFVYEMINAFGGPEAFYSKFYINSLCPLGFTTIDEKGKEKNYNYYDSLALIKATTGYIIENIRTQISLG